jgi:hypothetical protein
VKRARELIYTAERQASRDVGLPGLRLKPGSSQKKCEFNVTQTKYLSFIISTDSIKID